MIGSGAVPTTSMSASEASVSERIFRTMAESSITRTRILRVSAISAPVEIHAQAHGKRSAVQQERPPHAFDSGCELRWTRRLRRLQVEVFYAAQARERGPGTNAATMQ